MRPRGAVEDREAVNGRERVGRGRGQGDVERTGERGLEINWKGGGGEAKRGGGRERKVLDRLGRRDKTHGKLKTIGGLEAVKIRSVVGHQEAQSLGRRKN